MYELIYNNQAIDLIKKRFPIAVFKDASDYIHVGRFEVEIEGVDEDEFYPFAIVEGFALACFKLQLELLGMKPDSKQRVEKWLELAKEEKENQHGEQVLDDLRRGCERAHEETRDLRSR